MSLSRFNTYLISFFISINCSFGQYQLSIGDLTFQNKKEKKLFHFLAQKEKGISLLNLALISSSDYDADIATKCSQDYNNLLVSIKNKISKNWSVARTTKFLHKKIQKTLFKKYKTHANFEDIFEVGQFNCVTATMLYTLLFDDLKIPYEIKLKPFHVYIIVDPKHEELLLETTNIVEGINKIDFEVKKDYIDLLVKSKRISAEELKTKSLQSLYNEYYFGKEQIIDFQGLIATQYYNNAVRFLAKKQYDTALQHIKKSEYLHPSPRNHYILFHTLYQLVSNLDYSSPENVKPLFELYQLYPTLEVKNEMLQQFTLLSNELVFKNGEIEKFNSFYKAFKNGLKDTAVLKDIQEIYYSQLAKAYCLNYNHKQALIYAEKAYAINPKNISTKRLLSDIVFDYVSLNDNDENVFKLLENKIKKYKFLTLDPRINKLLGKATDKSVYQANGKLVLSNTSAIIERLNSSLLSTNSSVFLPNSKTNKILSWFKLGLQYQPNYDLFQKVIKGEREKAKK